MLAEQSPTLIPAPGLVALCEHNVHGQLAVAWDGDAVGRDQAPVPDGVAELAPPPVHELNVVVLRRLWAVARVRRPAVRTKQVKKGISDALSFSPPPPPANASLQNAEQPQ
jgi:hypothetical protein